MGHRYLHVLDATVRVYGHARSARSSVFSLDGERGNGLGRAHSPEYLETSQTHSDCGSNRGAHALGVFQHIFVQLHNHACSCRKEKSSPCLRRPGDTCRITRPKQSDNSMIITFEIIQLWQKRASKQLRSSRHMVAVVVGTSLTLVSITSLLRIEASAYPSRQRCPDARITYGDAGLPATTAETSPRAIPSANTRGASP